MTYINPHRSFVTTVSIRGIPDFDLQVYGIRPSDVNERDGYEIVGDALRRRKIIPDGADFFMSSPRADLVAARNFRKAGRLPA